MSEREGFLLDTNVLSATRKARMDPGVRRLIETTPSENLFVSVLTIGEFWKGVAMKRRQDQAGAARLDEWTRVTETEYAERMLGVDVETMRLWGEWSAVRTRPVIDTLLAATAVRHGLTFVTRNVSDVAGIPVKVLNPWSE